MEPDIPGSWEYRRTVSREFTSCVLTLFDPAEDRQDVGEGCAAVALLRIGVLELDPLPQEANA